VLKEKKYFLNIFLMVALVTVSSVLHCTTFNRILNFEPMSVKIVESGWLNFDWTDKSFFHSQAHKLLSFGDRTIPAYLGYLSSIT